MSVKFRPKLWAGRLACISLVILLTGCNDEKVESFNGPTMGSTYQIQYVAGTKAPKKAQIQSRVQSILETLDRTVSTYRNDSNVAQFNATSAGTCRHMPASVFQLLEFAKTLHKDSDGAYDITLLPALSAWGFGPSGRVNNRPTKKQLSALRTFVGMQYIHTETEHGDATPQSICKDSDSTIEFNSIAAGYAVDRISDDLRDQGITNFLVEITGELRANGKKPDGSPWRIALEAPISHARVAQRIVSLDGMAASTSGDYRDYFEEGGIRYSHTLDPRTLSPVSHKLASVSVIADTAMFADGYSTLLMVLGPKRGYEFAVKHQLSALFIISNGTEKKTAEERTFTVRTTPVFEKRFPKLKGSS